MTHFRRSALSVALFLALPRPALACGGFFCSQIPVDQAAERILVHVDEAAGTIETHVEITYEGEAPDFSWIVPVPAIPEVLLSSDLMFNSLDPATTPRFQVNWNFEGECFSDDSAVSSSATSAGPPSGGGVTIHSQERVGPYETVVLSAADSTALTDWLTANGYTLPSGLDTVLAPYASADSAFIALRLANGMDSGDLAPIAFRYAGSRPSIPIQLTAIAANEDMRLEVTVLGPHRAVPESYLHLTANEAAIDWTSGGANYTDVVRLAANEAGGHGFATDVAGPAPAYAANIPTFGGLSGARSASDAGEWLYEIGSAGLYGSSLAVVIGQFVEGADADAEAIASCPSCYAEDYSGVPIDADAATDAVIEFVVDPTNHARDLLEASEWLTRLTSSLSPVEMTVDPTFVFNPTLGEVGQVREATIDVLCGSGARDTESPLRMTLSDGRIVYLPPLNWPGSQGQSMAQFLDSWHLRAAHRIEQSNADGPAAMVFDGDATPDENLEALNTWVQFTFLGGLDGTTGGVTDPMDETANEAGAAQGCGCNQSSPPWAAGLALLALIRRRR